MIKKKLTKLASAFALALSLNNCAVEDLQGMSFDQSSSSFDHTIYDTPSSSSINEKMFEVDEKTGRNCIEIQAYENKYDDEYLLAGFCEQAVKAEEIVDEKFWKFNTITETACREEVAELQKPDFYVDVLLMNKQLACTKDAFENGLRGQEILNTCFVGTSRSRFKEDIDAQKEYCGI